MILYKKIRYQIVIWVAVVISKINSQGVPDEEYGMPIGANGLREKVICCIKYNIYIVIKVRFQQTMVI